MRFLAAIFLWFSLALSGATQELSPPVLIINSDRVYAESAYGQRIEADLAALVADLQAENDTIAQTLRAEELSLTERRPDMDPAAFRAEADAFDSKVQDVREARDAKNAELQVMSAEARAQFNEGMQEVVAEVMLERGAQIVMEQRSVLLSVSAANITDMVIARMNAELGDGAR